MAVETALYPSQFNTNWPTAADMVSEGDDHLRLIKIVDKTTWPNVAGAVSASHIELNYLVGVTSGIQAQLNAKGAIAGQTWTGAHVYSGSIAVPTLTQGTSTTGAASTAFVQNEWSTRLPNYSAPITASSTELNYVAGVTSAIQTQLNTKGAIAGQTWSGAHSFSGSVAVPTMAAGDNTTNAASTAFVSAAAFASALPLQTGNAGKFVTTDGVTASWAPVSFTSLSGKPTTVSGYGITDAVTTSGAQTIAGNKSFSGNVLLTGSGGLGYGVGSGGTVTQATSKSTAVTLNKPSGMITLNASSMSAGVTEIFQFNNSSIVGPCGLVLNLVAGSGTLQSYNAWASVGNGYAIIYFKNISAGALAEAVGLYFEVINGATS